MTPLHIILIFVLGANLLLMRPYGPIPQLVAAVAICIYWAYIHRQARPLNRWSLLFALTYIMSHIVQIYTASRAVGTFVSIADLVLLPLILVSSSRQPKRVLDILASGYTLMRSYLSSMGLSISRQDLVTLSARAQDDTRTPQPRANRYLLGVLVSIPVVLLLIALLSSDPIFYHRIQDLIPLELLQEVPGRVVMSILLMLILIPTLSLARTLAQREPSSLEQAIARLHAPEVALVMSSLVTLVLGAFISIQWPYIFASVRSEFDLPSYGVKTFSEYVTRGFTELMLASIVVLGVIAVSVIVRRNSQHVSRVYQLVSLLLISGYTLLVISCLRRVMLYMEYHGLTVIRVYGTYVLVLLMALVPLILIRMYTRRAYMYLEATLICALYLCALSTSADRLIAVSYPPTVNSQVDIVYLSRLSADGVSGWQRAYTQARETLTDPQLLSKPTLDARDIQRIAKASLSIGYLAMNYHDLSAKYLSHADYAAYRGTLMRAKLAAYRDHLVYLQSLTPSESTRSTIEYTQGLVERLGSCLNSMDDQNTCMGDFGIQMSVPTDPQWALTNYKDQDILTTDSHYTVFEFPGGYDLKTQGGRPGHYAHWYSYNASEAHVYESLRSQAYMSHLLELMRASTLLERKIIALPKEQREYERDISLETPLL